MIGEELQEDEVSETFTLTQPPTRIGVEDLPRSPKSTYLAATACGWAVSAWLSVGEVAPTLYVGNSDEGAKKPYNAGDVKWDGYTARLFIVEARVLDLPLGFRAHYLGKQYGDGRAAPLGGFDYALAVDPVGVPRALRADYNPIKQLRGKFETGKSFLRRQNDAKTLADEMAAAYNDGGVTFETAPLFAVAGEFDSWLAEWQSFTGPTIKKATTK